MMANPTLQETNGNGSLQSSSVSQDSMIELNEYSNNEQTEELPEPVEKIEDCKMEVVQEKTDNILEDTSIMETSANDLDIVEKSPKKTSASSSDSDSDASAEDSKHPAEKRLKKNTGNYEGLKRHRHLRKTLEPFIQKKACEKLKANLGKCLECRSKVPRQGRKGKDSICRFLLFRKLRYNERGTLTIAGFPDSESSHEEYSLEDSKYWTPTNPPKEMTVEWAKFLLEEVGDQFCDLVNQEKDTQALLPYGQVNLRIIWRRIIENLRELCDVCSTTLFNFHWTCGRCGFVVCASCFKVRKFPPNNLAETAVILNYTDSKDSYGWLKCHAKAEHELGQLYLTEIIAKKTLNELWTKLHTLRRNLKMPCHCASNTESPAAKEDEKDNTNPVADSVDTTKCTPDNPDESSCDTKEITTSLEVKDSKACEKDQPETENGDDDDNSEADDFFDEIFQDGDVENISVVNPGDSEGQKENSTQIDSSELVKSTTTSESRNSNSTDVKLSYFVRKGGSTTYKIKVLPIEVLRLVQTEKLYPNVPHALLCQGSLLRLKDPVNPGNLPMFQHQWKRGQPVIVSNVGQQLSKDLWTPQSFSNDFGHKIHSFINCMTGKVVPNQKMKKFWDGFENVKLRMRDDEGQPMLLKLKDWPPGDDFAEVLPKRFKDLMNALPLGEYTHRDGKLNLAARLPDIFCKPDLGPKMYIAYGSGLHLDKGTTNLHLDVSDAVNVMVHVGVVQDDDTLENDKAVMKAIEDSDCDLFTINRVVNDKELPGALWHIWEAKDADKIRDMMNKCALEKGLKIEKHHDPIHDQSWYLDSDLRKKLRLEYNVVGYPILQCEGDAVFIPAGAPHQVRNLNNCIKIAEDFVSPENVGHCFYLTEEFRNLTETHTNHEDKLQIKNIVYHTVKDAVAIMLNQPAQN